MKRKVSCGSAKGDGDGSAYFQKNKLILIVLTYYISDNNH